MIEQAIDRIKNFHGNLDFKYENIDFLDLIESDKRCTEEICQQSKFCAGCTNSRFCNIKNFKYYFNYQLENLKLQMVDYKSHFKKPCFNCSSSFHCSSFEDGYFNLQKMLEVGQKCGSCIKNFTSERSFFHNCNICNASFKNCKVLIRHRRGEHNSKKTRQCAVCHISLLYNTFYHHIKKHKLPHKCPYCNKRYPAKICLKLHIISHTGEFAQKQFSCKYCPKQFTRKQNLDIHLFEHTGGKQFKCDECNKYFVNGYSLNRHKLTHMEKSFHCKYCPKEYSTKTNLNIHLFDHTGGKKFKCDLCDKSYAKAYLLNQHISNHIGKLFHCNYCTKKYATQQALDIHLFKHTLVKRFKCDVCNKTFDKRFKLNQHKIYHTKEFQCDLCDKLFSTQYLLNQHKFTHNIERSFQCNYCPKKYKSKGFLDVHLFEHIGGKEFKCDWCNKTFAKQFMLNKHKLCHSDKTIQCPFCSKFFKTAKCMKNHIKCLHKSLPYNISPIQNNTITIAKTIF